MENMKKGFTLIELGISLGILGSLALVDVKEAQFEDAQAKARSLGNEIFQYNSAVSRYLAAHAGDSSVATLHSGADWLKGVECSGGSADGSYLVCELFPANETLQYGLIPTTRITYSPEGQLAARTVWETVVGSDGKPDSMVMGTAALVASGNYLSQSEDAAAGYQAPTIFCPDMASISASISALCDTDRNAMISLASVNSSVEPWLRTDHANTMRHVIEFNENGDLSPEADLQASENRAGNAWLRQVVNVARLYNEAGFLGQSLTLGGRTGNAIYADTFLSSNSLLNGAIIMDGDVGMMNDVYVKANANIGNDLDVGRDITATRDIRTTAGNVFADSGQVRGGYVRSLSDVQADRDLRANRYGYAQRYYDNNDTSKYLDPASRSQINDLTASGDIRAPIFYDLNNTSRYMNPAGRSIVTHITATGDIRAGRFYDQNNTGYYTDPASTSRMNAVDANSVVSRGRLRTNEFLHLNRNVNPGWGCGPSGLVGRTADGTLASCVSGRWKSSGGGVKGRYRTEIRRGNTVKLKSASDWQCAVGGFYNGKSSTAQYDVYVSGGFWYGRATDYELRVNCWQF